MSSTALQEPYGFTWSFVALEYYALMLNRIYLVCVGERMISGLYMGGPVAALPLPDAAWVPGFWISERRLRRYAGVNVAAPGLRWQHLMNFQHPRDSVTNVSFNARPKWGMGNVPYSGRIHVGWDNGRQREFILLGRQDGPAIRDRLQPSAARLSVGSNEAVPSPVFDPLRPISIPGF